MSMLQDQLLPAIHERVVFVLSNKRLEESQREALLLSLANTLRRAATGVKQMDTPPESSLVTEDRFSTRINSRRQVLAAMASASGLNLDVVGATLLLVEVRVDVAIDYAGSIDISGIGKFSRPYSKDPIGSSERASQWCQRAFTEVPEFLLPRNSLIDLLTLGSARALRQLIARLEIAEAFRPPYPYEASLSSSGICGEFSQSEEGDWE